MVADGVASTGEIDDAIIYGPGLRWAFMGTCLTFHLAGGEAGMRHMLEQFGPALKLPWTRLEAPELSDALIDAMVEGTREQAGGRSIAELERTRDQCLIAIMRSLRPFAIGAGNTIAGDEQRRFTSNKSTPWHAGDSIDTPLALYRCRVHADWVDYNGHMGESFYLYAFGWASDALFRYVGIDDAYRASGRSFYTVESHINYYREASLGEQLYFTTQILNLDDKRLHLFHSMLHADSDVAHCHHRADAPARGHGCVRCCAHGCRRAQCPGRHHARSPGSAAPGAGWTTDDHQNNDKGLMHGLQTERRADPDR